MKRYLSVFMSLALIFVFFTAEASAKEKTSSQKASVTSSKITYEQFAEKFWAPWGMDKATQQKLINKMKKGEMIDADNPAMSSQATVETFQKVDEYGVNEEVTKSTFPDGSISVTTVEKPTETTTSGNNGAITPFATAAVGGGTVSCGSGYCVYHNVKVSRQGGTTYAEFFADFENLDGAYDQIDAVRDYSITMAGSYSQTTLTKNKAYENASGRAYATLQFEGTTPGSYVSSTFRLRLYVGNDSYSATSTW